MRIEPKIGRFIKEAREAELNGEGREDKIELGCPNGEETTAGALLFREIIHTPSEP